MYVSLNKMLNATNLGFMEHNYPYITPICSISSSPQRKRSIHNSNDNYIFFINLKCCWFSAVVKTNATWINAPSCSLHTN